MSSWGGVIGVGEAFMVGPAMSGAPCGNLGRPCHPAASARASSWHSRFRPGVACASRSRSGRCRRCLGACRTRCKCPRLGPAVRYWSRPCHRPCAVRPRSSGLRYGPSRRPCRSGPLATLRHLVEVLADDSDSPALAAGEVVTTGTLTEAYPIRAGETWDTRIAGLLLADIRLAF